MKGKILPYLFIVFISLHAIPALSQKETWNWYFGNNAGLSFSSGTPVPLPGGMTHTLEGTSVMSDANGALLFYTDGITVWNRNHAVMLNGGGLLGDMSSTQSALIIPKPLNDSLYFIFTVAAFAHPQGMCYSVVNLKADGGLGAVITKNVAMVTPVCEGLTAVKNCNGQDYWVVTRQFNGTEFYSWKVSSSGISNIPVRSATTNYIGNPFLLGTDAIGFLKVSPDGKKIANLHHGLSYCELGEFDNSTGAVTNVIKIAQIPPVPERNTSLSIETTSYGMEFSGDSRRLYLDLGLMIYDQSSPDPSYYKSTLNQYDLLVHDSVAIANSHYFVDSFNSANSNRLWNALQMGPDGKIYSASFLLTSLGCIRSPNLDGAFCDYQRSAVSIGTGVIQLGLPNFCTSYFNKKDFLVTANCNASTFSFEPSNPAGIDSVKWDFGEPVSGPANNSTLMNPVHAYSATGNYTVQLRIYSHSSCRNLIDTVQKIIAAGAIPVLNIGRDTAVCLHDSITLTSDLTGSSYSWSTGASTRSVRVTQAGRYWLQVNINACSYSDTIVISDLALPVFSLGRDTLVCGTGQLYISPTPVYVPATYSWSDNSSANQLNVTATGSYWLQITDASGCKYRDTVQVDLKPYPLFSLGRDTSICSGDSLVLNAAVSGATGYAWSTGQSVAIVKAANAGNYWCEVGKDGCTYRDTLVLAVKPLPAVHLGRDTIICEDKTYLLDATNPSAIYDWQDHSTQSSFMVTSAGTYSVTVTMNGCRNADTVLVKYQLKPHFSLGPDKEICTGITFPLTPQITAGSDVPLNYLWQDGSTTPTYTVTQPGTYTLQIGNTCGTTTDQLVVTTGTCTLYIPSAFTPNGDGLNDLFRSLYGDNLVSFHMQIFNRNGEQVFGSKDRLKGWDGIYKGIAQPEGTFVWMLHYKVAGDPAEYMRKGTVTLIR